MKAILRRTPLFVGVIFTLVLASSCGHHVCATYCKKAEPVKQAENADEFALNK